MISVPRKYIFIHIPKTGGTSIEKFLNLKGFQHDAHSFYDKSEYEKYFRFTVVRNPWDKVVSDYEWMTNDYIYLNKNPIPCPKVKQIFIGRGFNFFVKAYLTYTHKDLRPHRSKQWFDMHFDTHRKSQLEFLNPIEKINFICKFENLQSDFNSVCKQIGLRVGKLPHKNKTRRKEYKYYYDEESHDLVQNFYKKDIDYFGYKF